MRIYPSMAGGMMREPHWQMLICLVGMMIVWGGTWAVIGYTAARLNVPIAEAANPTNGKPFVLPLPR